MSPSPGHGVMRATLCGECHAGGARSTMPDGSGHGDCVWFPLAFSPTPNGSARAIVHSQPLRGFVPLGDCECDAPYVDFGGRPTPCHIGFHPIVSYLNTCGFFSMTLCIPCDEMTKNFSTPGTPLSSHSAQTTLPCHAHSIPIPIQIAQNSVNSGCNIICILNSCQNASFAHL